MHTLAKNLTSLNSSPRREMLDNPLLAPISAAETARFRRDICKSPHHIAETGLFSDDALAALIDAYPRDRLQCFTMGTAIEHFEQLQPVDVRDVAGKDVIRAIRAGRLWFKLQRIDLSDGPYAALVHDVYAALTARHADFRPQQYNAVLLLSSPGAVVYFHADANPNLLFHLRGHKQVWLYPDGHRTLIDQATLEDIFVNHRDEEVPYDPAFESHARLVELSAGEMLSWPHNTPHRVTACGDFNVSISSFYQTEESERRVLLYSANRLLRTKLGVGSLSVAENSLRAKGKMLLYRGARKLGLAAAAPNRKYMAAYRIDASAPEGVAKIPDGPVRTEFR